jgi:hypothetical protein
MIVRWLRMSKFKIRMIRSVIGKDNRSDRERMIVGMSKERRTRVCSACVAMILAWLDNIASITSRVVVDGNGENRMKVVFSPVRRKFKSLKTCHI